MNAPLEVKVLRREDYFPNVSAFMPLASGKELELRASLLLIRDRAMATKRRSSEYGWEVLDLVERIARDNALREMPVDCLEEIRRLVIRLVSTASGFDVLFAPEPSATGGANGGG